MKNLIIAGNWKSQKTVSETKNWFNGFNQIFAQDKFDLNSKTIIVCGSFSSLYPMQELKNKYLLPIEIGAQDISPFPKGAYTGEENAMSLKELADWVIIGHSERRKFIKEDDYELFFEVKQAKSVGLKVIYCVPDIKTKIPENIDVVGYEPVFAIGTGITDTPENANKVTSDIKKINSVEKVIYGGSVTEKNVKEFTNQPAIDGVLVGGASLDPQIFLNLIKNA